MFRKFRKKASFLTWNEILIGFVVIGILAFFAVSQVKNSQNRARVDAAYMDLNQFHEALEMYWDDYHSNPENLTLENCVGVLKDPQGKLYKSLPTGANFKNFIYTHDKNTYRLRVKCFDEPGTILIGSPTGIVKAID